MKELEYPFIPQDILLNKRRIKKKLLSDGRDRIYKRVAILGGSTTADVAQIMELFLLDIGIEPEFYEADYNQYYKEALFPSEELINFKPDVVYIHTGIRNIMTFPAMSMDREEVDALFELEKSRYADMWQALEKNFQCPIIQNNFELPFYRLLGNKDASDYHGAVNYITRLNMSFYEYAQFHENFFICDVNYISADYGLKEWSNPFYWYNYKYALALNAIPYLCFNVSNIIKSIFGKNKKGLVLDLDNTLWGGVIGDDGIEGIEIGRESSNGEVYTEFQQYIKAHKDLGIILNIDSKNDEDNALEGLKHPDNVLKPDDFIIIKSNWESKDRNFIDIANELKLLPESLLFVDDNPAERSIVTGQIQGVVAPDIGPSHRCIQNLDRGGYFEVTYISEDDSKRNKMYIDNIKREKFENTFSDYHEYLLNLRMKGIIRPFEPIYCSRIAQLSNKSNQFNLTTKRYSEKDIQVIANDSNYITLYGKLIDRFGDNGVVAAVIGHIIDNKCHIELWIMSCRVLKREMETAMMDKLIDNCKLSGVSSIIGYYYPTSKNKIVRDFYKTQGFKPLFENSEKTVWEYKIDAFNRKKQNVIEV